MPQVNDALRRRRNGPSTVRTGPRVWNQEIDHELGHQLDQEVAPELVAQRPRVRTPDDEPLATRSVIRRLRKMWPRDWPKPTGRDLASLAAFVVATAGAAVLASRTELDRSDWETRLWYRRLEKAPFNPPDWVFAPVWAGLYALIAASGWRVWRAGTGRSRTAALGLWATQLGLNAAWSHIFVGRRQPKVALAELGALLAAITGYAIVARKMDRAAAWMMAPYLAWTGFAAVLNAEIVRRN